MILRSLILLLGVNHGARAASSMFDVADIEHAIVDYYAMDAQGKITGDDRDELDQALASEVVVLRPASYNDVVGHLVDDYVHHPEDREPIEQLMGALGTQIAPELEKNRENGPVTVVLDDVFNAWTAAYAFGFGKGVWLTRGSGLRGLPQFERAVANVAANLPKGKRLALGITAAGAAAGLAQVVYESLETKKLDPTEILQKTQAQIVHATAVRIAAERDELRSFAKTKFAGQRARVAAILADMSDSKAELAHLSDKNVAPQLRGEIHPISLDLLEMQSLLYGAQEKASDSF